MHAFANILIPSYREDYMDKLPGAQFWLPMHPMCAQYKTLISAAEMCAMGAGHTLEHKSQLCGAWAYLEFITEYRDYSVKRSCNVDST